MPAAAACRQAMVDAGGVATGKKKTKTLQFPFLKEKTFFGRRRREGHPIETLIGHLARSGEFKENTKPPASP